MYICIHIYDFVLYNFAERFSNGWALLGEVKEKWVGVSKASMERVTTASDSDVTVVVQGSPKEMVTLTFVPPTGESTMDMMCQIGDDIVLLLFQCHRRCVIEKNEKERRGWWKMVQRTYVKLLQ